MLDPAKIKSKAIYSRPGAFYSLGANVANGRLYAGSTDYTVQVFDLAAEKKEPVESWTRHANYVSALAFVSRPPVRLVVSGSYDRTLVWRDADLGEVIRSVPAHDGWVRGLAAFPDGNRLVSVGDDMLVKLWETASGKPLAAWEGHARRTPQGHLTALYAVAVSPDGKFVASGDRIGEVRVWEADSGNLAQSFQVPILYTYDPRQRKRSIGGIRSLAFSPDGGQLAVGGIGEVGNVDGLSGPAHVEVWDWRQPKLLLAAEGDGHKGLVNDLYFTADGAWLLGGGGGTDDGFIAVWKAPEGNAAATPEAGATASAGSPAAGVEAAAAKPVAPARLIKTGGHIHRFVFNEVQGEFYAAGHGKLEVFDGLA